MKIEVNEEHDLVLKKVFNTVILKTEEGNQFAICMRDNTVEMKIVGSDKWYRANMHTGTIDEL